MNSNKKIHNGKICSILVGNSELKYLLVRSSRKTIGISVQEDGTVLVSAPVKVSESYIEQLVQKKAKWILSKQEEVVARKYISAGAKKFVDGESFSYLGEIYKLKITKKTDIKKPVVELKDEMLEISLPHSFDMSQLRNVLALWYIERFKIIVEDRVNHYSRSSGTYPKNIFIKEQKTRWGSCSSKGNINLNWKLIMAPREVIDYVIIHELCHMKEMNHSNKFWKLVEEVQPKYKEWRNWLKINGNMLGI